jgi:hypothetical protein
MSEPADEYQERLVFFADFLGFKEHIDLTLIEPDHISRVSKALKMLGEIGELYEGFESKRVSQFSDSLVVSFEITEESAVFWLVDAIATQIVILAEHGFLVRGGVTVGKLFHTGQQVFGPALVAAHKLESENAVVPRVLVDKSVFSAARKAKSKQHSADYEVAAISTFVSKDSDGHNYLDYVSWKAVVEAAGFSDDLHPGYLSRLGKLIEAGLNHSVPTVAGKYVWLQKQLKLAIETVRQLPADHPYREQSPRNCAVVEALDDLERLAATVENSALPKWMQV